MTLDTRDLYGGMVPGTGCCGREAIRASAKPRTWRMLAADCAACGHWKTPVIRHAFTGSIEQPQRLLALVLQGRLAEHDLTFAAEALGRVAAALPVLFALARDGSRLVREGAVYGLARHVSNADVRAVLARMSKEDPSPGVRTAAAEALL